MYCACVCGYTGGSRIQPVAFCLFASHSYMHTYDSKGLHLTLYNICSNHILPWLQVMWMQPHTDICSWER